MKVLLVPSLLIVLGMHMTPLSASNTTTHAVATHSVADSTQYFRDSQGRLIERIDMVKDGTGGYRPHLRKLYNYTPAGKLSETGVFFFREGKWANVQRTTLSYAATGDTAQYLVQIAKGALWENQKMVAYEYEGEKISGKTLKLWTDGAWENASRQMYQFLPSEQRYLVHTEQTWNGEAWSIGRGPSIPSPEVAMEMRR